VVQSTQDREGEDLVTSVIWSSRLTKLVWKLLPNALMRPGSIEGLHRGVKDTIQLLFLQDEQVIETRSPDTQEKPFADRIGSRRMGRRDKHLHAEGLGHTRETGSKLAITITNKIVRRLSVGSRLPERYGRSRYRSEIASPPHG
jgi:hypothetical protein